MEKNSKSVLDFRFHVVLVGGFNPKPKNTVQIVKLNFKPRPGVYLGQGPILV